MNPSDVQPNDEDAAALLERQLVQTLRVQLRERAARLGLPIVIDLPDHEFSFEGDMPVRYDRLSALLDVLEFGRDLEPVVWDNDAV